MKRLLLVLLLILPLVMATQNLGTFQQNKNINLIQTCDNCTYVNITKVQLPDSTIIEYNDEMTKTGSEYNFTFTNTSQIGKYIYTTCGDDDGIFKCVSVQFAITPSGQDKPTDGEGWIFVVSVMSMFAVAIFFYFVSRNMNEPINYFFVGLTFILSLIAVFYSFVGLNEILGGFEKLINSYQIFFYVILMVSFLLFIFIMLVITIRAINSLNVRRGLR